MTSLERLIREEQQLQFDRFDHDTVWALGVALVEAAQAAGAPLATEIRRNGHQLFHAALHGTAPDNDAWLARKARAVDRFGHSSLYVGGPARRARRSRSRCAWTVAPTPRTAGVPRDDAWRRCGGQVAVSGLPQLENHAFVVRVLSAFLEVDL